MTDEDVRELERAVALAPGDVELRVRLARALARAGSARRALDALSGVALTGEARKLSQELWISLLGRLEVARRIPITAAHAVAAVDLTGRLVGWGSRETDAHFGIAELETGNVVHIERDFAAWTILPVTNGFFVASDVATHASTVRCFLVTGTLHSSSGWVDGFLRAARPDAERIITRSPPWSGVHSWPSCDRLLLSDGGLYPDWHRDRFVTHHRRDGRHEITWSTVDDRIEASHVVEGPAPVQVLDSGIAIVGSSTRASLSADRRSLRMSGRDSFVALPVEPDARVIEVPGSAPARDPVEALFHPHADVALLDPDGLRELRSPTGMITRLPTDALAWSPDGHSLIGFRRAGDAGELEVWSTPAET